MKEIHVNSDFVEKLIVFIQVISGQIEQDKKSRIVVEYNPEEKKTIIQIHK